jgi:hypothetical protein
MAGGRATDQVAGGAQRPGRWRTGTVSTRGGSRCSFPASSSPSAAAGLLVAAYAPPNLSVRPLTALPCSSKLGVLPKFVHLRGGAKKELRFVGFACATSRAQLLEHVPEHVVARAAHLVNWKVALKPASRAAVEPSDISSRCKENKALGLPSCPHRYAGL